MESPILELALFATVGNELAAAEIIESFNRFAVGATRDQEVFLVEKAPVSILLLDFQDEDGVIENIIITDSFFLIQPLSLEMQSVAEGWVGFAPLQESVE